MISKELDKRLKFVAIREGKKYEKVLKNMLTSFEKKIPFESERQFANWFEKNIKFFGFEECTKSQSPDYIVKTMEGKMKRVELELLADGYNHPPNYCDFIVCVYSNTEKINGVPVLAIKTGEEVTPEIVLTNTSRSVSLESELWVKIERFSHDHGFSDISSALEHLVKRGLKE